MEIKIKKPELPKLPQNMNLSEFKWIDYLRTFYVFDGKQKQKLEIKRLTLIIVILMVLSLILYALTSYIRSDELEYLEVLKQVLFINVTLWIAFVLFATGLNLIILLVAKSKKVTLNQYNFVSRQILTAVTMFFFMRVVATVLILMDELLPFEIQLNLRIFLFNLLTILFVSQIWMLIVVYRNLMINLGSSLSKYPLVETLIAVLYLASMWSLASP